MNVILTMMAKALATEKYAEKGWFGFIEKTPDGHHDFSGTFTRQQMADEVMKYARIHGEHFLTAARETDITKGNKTIFVPFREAKTADEAARIIEDNMAHFRE